MNTSSHNGLYQSANSSTSTLRPRATRLISYLDDENPEHEDEATAVSTSSSTTPLRPQTRSASPNVSLNRSKSAEKFRHGRANKSQIGSPSDSQQKPAGGQGLWESWSSIQGLASTLLGNDIAGPSKDRANGPFKPVWMKQDKHYISKTPTPRWGPGYSATTSSAQGAIEERQALVQAKKREALLLASASESRDSSGRYKRRDSGSGLAVPTSTDSRDDALVYLHTVQKGDTLAGVVIKYNCQAEAFRKINRFWPNDNIQTRTHVLLPLEACTARGKKVDSPYLTRDLFDSSIETSPTQPAFHHISPSSANGQHDPFQNPSPPSEVPLERLSLITSLSEEVEFKHDSWVMLPNANDAVEVLRVPRRALGFFPRARRKSNTTLNIASTASTPKTSFDLLRHPPTHAAQTSASLNASPVLRPKMASRLGSGRRRSSSATGGSGNSFAEALRGPGGVGTLRGLRTEVSRPGPAEDPLNRQFGQYLPDLLPPEEMPRTGLSLRPTPRATPRVSSDSIRSTRSNSNGASLGEVGGAIEGWVRKMAGVKRERGAAVDKMGDLIELETNSEVPELGGDRQNPGGRLDNNIFEATTPSIGGIGTGSGTASQPAAVASATEEALLNERFPVRGRMRNAYASGSNSGKDKDD